ncbi:MAG: biopolymer transporter ExbD [Prevotella sp.]|nr:biopolymer transporter ExbD [Prevotella sp.]
MALNIRRKKQRQVPGLNMTSMPDLIFTVLFFFMIVTHMRNETVKVDLTVPEGTELSKPATKRSIINIYIGTDARGVTRIQVNENLCDIKDVNDRVREYRSSLSEEAQEEMVVNIRADRETPMSVINELKTELRKADALKIRYSALEKKE